MKKGGNKMKNMFKRVMALLLALVMTMSLAACGNNDYKFFFIHIVHYKKVADNLIQNLCTNR